VWAATDDGVGRFDGKDWSLVHRGHAFSKVAVAPDGTVFVVGPSGIARIAGP